MKVLQVYNKRRLGGGSENAAMATTEALRERGLEIRTFVRDSKDLSRDLRGRWQAFAGAIYARRAVREFDDLLVTFRPDVVHVHEVFPLISAWVLPRCKRRGVPAVVSVYDYRLTCPVVTHVCRGQLCTKCVGGREFWGILKNCRGRIFESVSLSLHAFINRKWRLYIDHADRFVMPSEFTLKWLVKHAKLPPERVLTIPFVIDIPTEAVDPAAGSYVAYAGRFAPEKGVSTLVEAIHKTRRPLVLAGESLDVRGANGAEYITPLPWQGPADLARFYRRARMLVVPSTWFETFGIVAGEAMSHGLPVVASRIGALAELVEDGVTGLLFEPGNAVDLASKIELLWNDPELCRRLGRAGREKITRIAHKKPHTDLLVRLYADLAGDMPGQV